MNLYIASSFFYLFYSLTAQKTNYRTLFLSSSSLNDIKQPALPIFLYTCHYYQHRIKIDYSTI